MSRFAHKLFFTGSAPSSSLSRPLQPRPQTPISPSPARQRAGRVLHNVPAALGPRPDFQQVTDAFWLRAQEIYGSAVAGSAASAFGAVGLRPSIFDPCFGLPRPSPKCPR